MPLRPELPPRLAAFLAEHHVLVLATCRDGQPWTASCYYAFDPEAGRFLIASDPATRHLREALDNPSVAWAVHLETKTVGKIRGLQATGRFAGLEGAGLEAARALYLRTFPIARMMPRLDLWALEPDHLKLTDNRLGFGTKLLWTRAGA
jgi:hypothetical protein